jgi:hypothetical protein
MLTLLQYYRQKIHGPWARAPTWVPQWYSTPQLAYSPALIPPSYNAGSGWLNAFGLCYPNLSFDDDSRMYVEGWLLESCTCSHTSTSMNPERPVQPSPNRDERCLYCHLGCPRDEDIGTWPQRLDSFKKLTYRDYLGRQGLLEDSIRRSVAFIIPGSLYGIVLERCDPDTNRADQAYRVASWFWLQGELRPHAKDGETVDLKNPQYPEPIEFDAWAQSVGLGEKIMVCIV